MSQNMLGTLSLSEVQGPRDDFEQKLAGPEGTTWLAAFKRFLRKENPWDEAVSLLAHLRDVALGAVSRFVAADAFGADNPDGIKFFLGGNFKTHFLGKVEEGVGASTIRVHSLEKASRDPEIMAELGVERVIKLAHFYELIKAQGQGQGQGGPLLINGYVNIAYIEDENETVWAVDADWDSLRRGWCVGAYSVERVGSWGAGDRVLSRK